MVSDRCMSRAMRACPKEGTGALKCFAAVQLEGSLPGGPNWPEQGKGHGLHLQTIALLVTAVPLAGNLAPVPEEVSCG